MRERVEVLRIPSLKLRRGTSECVLYILHIYRKSVGRNKRFWIHHLQKLMHLAFKWNINSVKTLFYVMKIDGWNSCEIILPLRFWSRTYGPIDNIQTENGEWFYNQTHQCVPEHVHCITDYKCLLICTAI